MASAGDETVAYQGGRFATIEVDDGFPTVDDLTDRGLGPVSGRRRHRPRFDGARLPGRAPDAGAAVRDQGAQSRAAGAAARDARDVLGRGPRGGQPRPPAHRHGPQPRVRPRLPLHRDGVRPRRRHASRRSSSARGRSTRCGPRSSSARSSRRSAPPTGRGWSIATSSRRTSCSTTTGHAKLADFGLVRRLSELELAGASVGGTPTYMAPELFAGSPASPRSDLYAVGVMLYYLLSARLPFSSDKIGRLIDLHRRAPVPDIRAVAPEVNDDMVAILERCLAKDPNDRFEIGRGAGRDARGADRPDARHRDPGPRERRGARLLRPGGPRPLPDPGEAAQRTGSRRSTSRSAQGRHSERLLSVFSVCCPADPRHYEFALKLNAELTYARPVGPRS